MVVRRGQRAPLHLQAVVRIACEAAAQAGTVFAGVHAATARNARVGQVGVCGVGPAAPALRPAAPHPQPPARAGTQPAAGVGFTSSCSRPGYVRLF